MKKQKKHLILSITLLAIAIVYTILIQVIDVKPLGVNNSNIGFSSINIAVSEYIGTNMVLYNLTKVLGILLFIIAFIYFGFGAYQLIKRKSILKINKELLALYGLYIVIAFIYIFFEIVIINYRPILMDGEMEASYPSSHTLLAITVCLSAIFVNKSLFTKKTIKIVNIALFILMLVVVVGRLFSGVHWFTDIIGGILISSCLLMFFYYILNMVRSNKD